MSSGLTSPRRVSPVDNRARMKGIKGGFLGVGMLVDARLATWLAESGEIRPYAIKHRGRRVL
jgi:hypothetical protein